MRQQLNNQNGFTLIELMIATTVFSVILLAAASTLIQVGRMYYKGVITSKTQSVARTTIDDVSRSIQFSTGNLVKDKNLETKVEVVCLGNTRFTYVEGGQLDSGAFDGKPYTTEDRRIRHVLWQDKISSGGCADQIPDLLSDNPSSVSGSDGRELLEDNMRLQSFSVEPVVSGQDDLYEVRVKIVYYADKDLLDDFDNPTSCKGSIIGGQWCAISDLTSVVYSRARP